MKPIVIVGAGVSGLALAHALRKRGVPVLVIEAEARPGGKIQSDEKDGYLCERGPASYLDRKGALTELAREVGVAGAIVLATDAAQRRLVAHANELHPTPWDAKSLLASRLLSPIAKLRMALDFVLPRGPSAKGQEESVAAFGKRRLGVTAGERLLQPMVSGLYAGDANQISLPSAFPLVAAMERVDRSFLHAMRKELRQETEGAPKLSTFASGMHEFMAALGQALGASLRLGTRLLALAKHEEGYALSIENGEQRETLRTERLVLAIPAHRGASLLAPISHVAATTLAQIPYVPVTLVHLGYPASALAAPISAYGFFVPPSEPLRILGGIFPSMLFPGRAPEGHHLFSVRTGGARHPEFAGLPDAEVIGVADTELRRLLGLRSAPVFAHVVRHAHALPQYTLGHAERVATLMAIEKQHPGLYFHGNAFHNAGVPELVLRSNALAERIAQDLMR